jgi:two-component system, NtrC family, nitrogen regulation response regulator NtrX
MSGRILVVDDEAIAREILAAFLEDQGHEVITAGDGADALEKLKLEAPDLLFLDIFMPGSNGLDVIRQIRALDPIIPVVMITGVEDDQIAVDLLLEGATDFIRKPLRLEYVGRVVDACLAKRRVLPTL